MEPVESLLAVLRGAAADLMRQRSIRDLDKTLSGIVSAAVDTVPGADAGGLSISEDGRVSPRSPTRGAVTALDELQSELHEGPCITAIDDPPEDGLVLADDLAGDDAARWPRFAPRAVEAGYRSMLSTQLTTDGKGMRAALNLYASRPHVFDTNARVTAGLFGVQAAILLYGSRHAVNLLRAVDSRDVIGQAKGILMERFAVDEEGAFQMLVRSSQETNMKLVDVAHWLQRDGAERRHARRASEESRTQR